jgi:hypothetical protein
MFIFSLGLIAQPDPNSIFSKKYIQKLYGHNGLRQERNSPTGSANK